MHATHPTDVKNAIIDAALDQAKLPWRPSSVDTHGRSEKFPEKHKIFCFKDKVLFLKI